MAALQYVDVPGYNAVLLRDTYANLTKPEGLLTRAHEWLAGSDARWDGDRKCYVFPSNATLSFSYLDGPLDHFNHQGAAYQFVGIDEIVNIRENQALYVGFSRARKLEGYEDLPIRFRCASNPPTREQVARGAWVKGRYVDPRTRKPGKIFIPAWLEDNPHLDADDYDKSLEELDPITRAQLRQGDWEVQALGGMFEREWFQLINEDDELLKTVIASVRFWDFAATDPLKRKLLQNRGKDPDWTSGCRMDLTKQGMYVIHGFKRTRKEPSGVEDLVRQTAEEDGKGVRVRYEEEGGSAGKIVTSHFRRNILPGWDFKGIKPTKSKSKRAAPLASMADGGNVYIVRGQHVNTFLDSAILFPDGPHDDDIDSASGAFAELALGARVQMRSA
jgi:predicted phage terminase large subunit-like protein